MKVDILAIGVHPDDIELCAAGTLLKHQALGYSIGLCDLTRGELGTRGNGTLRLEEAEKARQIFGSDVPRENLGMADGFFQHDQQHILNIVKIIRKYKPKIILANAVTDTDRSAIPTRRSSSSRSSMKSRMPPARIRSRFGPAC